MGDQTAISWTDRTFNPWIGCTRISPACDHCYAETMHKRMAFGPLWGNDQPRHVTSDANWRKPLKWEREAAGLGRPLLVFCASMADVFEARSDLDPARARLWELIEATPHLIWQLLTKRPEQIIRKVPARWLERWPANVWVGCTVEDQHYADLRVPRLLSVPAAVRFLSCEPLLGPIDLGLGIDHRSHERDYTGYTEAYWQCLDCSTEDEAVGWTYTEHGIGWVIVGGESGGQRRSLDLDNARSLRDECVEAGVPFLFKQVGGLHPADGGCLLDGQDWHQFPSSAGDRGATPVAITSGAAPDEAMFQ